MGPPLRDPLNAGHESKGTLSDVEMPARYETLIAMLCHTQQTHCRVFPMDSVQPKAFRHCGFIVG